MLRNISAGGITVDEYREILRETHKFDEQAHKILKFNVECGLALYELCKLQYSYIDDEGKRQLNYQEHKDRGVTYAKIYLREGTKKIRVTAEKKNTTTYPRNRYVVMNTKLYDEFYYFINDAKHKEYERRFPNSTWYVFLPKHFVGDKFKGLHRSYINKLYKDAKIPFTPHLALRNAKILPGRHLHKYLIKSICTAPDVRSYDDETVEVHLGHFVGKVRYGSVLNHVLMFRMVEDTFARS